MENEDGSEIANSNGLAMEQNKQYIAELINERQNLDPSFVHAAKLLDLEIHRAQFGHEKDKKLLELHNDKPTRVILKVKVPADEFPKFNFIGKIIGPKGNSLRRIQDETECRMAVFGRGSMRDKEKEEEFRQQGGKYAHLNDDLHVHVEAFGHPIDVYRRLSFGLHELRRHLVPDYNDEVTQQQVQEMAVLNGPMAAVAAANRGRGRGTPSGPRGGSYPMQGNMPMPPAARGRGFSGTSSRGAMPFRQGVATGSPVPNFTPQAPKTDYSEPYEIGTSESFKSGDFDGRNVDISMGLGMDAQFRSASGGPMSVRPANPVAGFNSQTDNAFDNLASGRWGLNSGNNTGSFGKSPTPRSAVGLNRSHPYAPR